MARLAWFLDKQLKGNIAKVAAESGIAPATLSRYSEFDVKQVAELGAGPQRIPILLRILDALRIDPAKLATALEYGLTEAGFLRIMNATLCVDEKLTLVMGGTKRVERRLIRLEPTAQSDGSAHEQPTARAHHTYGRLQGRFAWYLDHHFRGRMEEMRQKTGLGTATLRKYAEIEGAERGHAGPQSIRLFCDILQAIDIRPSKLVVAAQYGANEGSFWTLLNADICAEETVIIRGDDGHRTERKLWRLEEGKAPG